MLFQDNPRSFLTGDDPFIPTIDLEETEQRIDQSIVFEQRHEGFIGIPHGGLPMGLCLDAWRRIQGPSYPIDVRFKFGGSGIGIGETAFFTVERGPESRDRRFLARITKQGDKTPYLRAEITPSSPSETPVTISKPPREEFRELPYYRNCFVCGHHRTEPGLQRRFRAHSTEGGHLITTEWGASSEDGDRTESFLITNDELHPAVLISIFDENTAWGGFMQTRACGLSVRLNLTLRRPVAKTEPLLFVGWPTGIRGNPRSPRFFLAEGTILSVADPDNPEPVVHGRGEWVIMNQYTQQIKKNLLPPNDWEWIFGESRP
ncbi:MAG: hypothetical protein P8182_10285 [Deltaproteobacteria bacterium]